MKADILVDTSIWIEYFNNAGSKSGDRLENLLLQGNVCGAGIILAELLQGAKVEKEYNAILYNYTALPIVDETIDTWVMVGKISYNLRREGVTIPVTELLIASLAIEFGLTLFTHDQHFLKIPDIKLLDDTENRE